MTRRLKMFRKDNPTSREVTDSNTLNFNPNFKFLRLKFFWRPRPPWGVHYLIASLGQSLAYVKI